ncbi:MAG TPA: SDR family oxidoreductase [Streptosporangiaceae bacterium]|jgi:3-oxoacyl-[acyl-carrier protein] reductase|nr:SDR family oxidoreductase [Streptosporangiaceae bacterium]
MGTLTGRTALVTGSSRGIGRGIARRLARDGARVAVHYGENAKAAEETAASIEADGGSSFVIGAQLGVDGDAERLFAEFDKQADCLDILVNNAGMGLFSLIDKVTPEEFQKVVAVNVQAPFFLAKEALKRLRDGGRIINISSCVTRVAFPEFIAYSLTKGAINTFTLTLAKGVADRGITVNAVAPGFVDTDMPAEVLSNPEVFAQATGMSAFNRLGQVEDIAGIVAFIASDDARWITGQIIDATGGLHL